MGNLLTLHDIFELNKITFNEFDEAHYPNDDDAYENRDKERKRKNERKRDVEGGRWGGMC